MGWVFPYRLFPNVAASLQKMSVPRVSESTVDGGARQLAHAQYTSGPPWSFSISPFSKRTWSVAWSWPPFCKETIHVDVGASLKKIADTQRSDELFCLGQKATCKNYFEFHACVSCWGQGSKLHIHSLLGNHLHWSAPDLRVIVVEATKLLHSDWVCGLLGYTVGICKANWNCMRLLCSGPCANLQHGVAFFCKEKWRSRRSFRFTTTQKGKTPNEGFLFVSLDARVSALCIRCLTLIYLTSPTHFLKNPFWSKIGVVLAIECQNSSRK